MSPGPPFAFNALKLLVGCQEEHLAYENCVMRFDVVIFLEQGAGCGYLFGARCRLLACGPADATAIPKPLEKRPLNGCSSSISSSCSWR